VSAPSVADVLVWVAHLCDTEESAHQYAWPPSEQDQAEASEWFERGQAVRDDFVRVTGGDPDGAIWRSGFASWEGGRG
jgi:hypothetical protein